MKLSGCGGGSRSKRARTGSCFLPVAMIVLLILPAGSRAQMPSRGPAPFAVGVGNAWIIPGGNLPLDDPDDGRYATPGTAFTQRLMWSPRPGWGIFIEGAFPIFGVDATAVQADYNRDPPVVEGSNTVTSWALGIRWRAQKSWRRGLYAEAALARNRAGLEIRQEGLSTEAISFSWETGWMAGAGWVVPVGPTFSLDGGIAHHEFAEDYFVSRWTAFRIMAVFTFGGSR